MIRRILGVAGFFRMPPWSSCRTGKYELCEKMWCGKKLRASAVKKMWHELPPLFNYEKNTLPDCR
jgi:hypothetical protein